MNHVKTSFLLVALLVATMALANEPVTLPTVDQAPEPADRLSTTKGDLLIYPFGHATMVLMWNDLTIAVDPIGGAARYADLPRPHLIVVTHQHSDHFDVDTVRDLAGENTVVVMPHGVAESIPANDPVALHNGESLEAHGIIVEAVPAYNHTVGRLEYHPQGRDNGYVLDLEGFRVYISGDTEDIPEMAELGEIDAAFLCMNLPWTMSTGQAARAAKFFRPAVLYPYHFKNKDGSLSGLKTLETLLEAERVTDVRILTWY